MTAHTDITTNPRAAVLRATKRWRFAHEICEYTGLPPDEVRRHLTALMRGGLVISEDSPKIASGARATYFSATPYALDAVKVEGPQPKKLSYIEAIKLEQRSLGRTPGALPKRHSDEIVQIIVRATRSRRKSKTQTPAVKARFDGIIALLGDGEMSTAEICAAMKLDRNMTLDSCKRMTEWGLLTSRVVRRASGNNRMWKVAEGRA